MTKPVQINVLAGLLGLDTATYSIGYITGWADGNAELVAATAARVLGCVHTLADALDALQDPTDSATTADVDDVTAA
ncbi:hypothetical protein ACQ7HM_21215 [Williamsia sp. MIQD14]|uniref:hypothetical protein n=1 Tax=Williamsia sp. MIQD14 TaxID=3425703 RepID=UPI003D9FB227